jgi:DNA invertase Pin-like site-specific DNA recombinase
MGEMLSALGLMLAVVLAFAGGCAVAVARRRLGHEALPASPKPRVPAAQATTPSRPLARERRAVGYVRVAGDAVAGGLAAHSTVIRRWSATNRMRLTRIAHDVERSRGQRGAGPALCWALERIAAGDADVLIVARLDHVCATVADLPTILEWFDSDERTLVAIDFRLDTATEAGQLVASALCRVAGWERERLSARTRRGLEAARARGSGQARAAVADRPELRERIARMREQGMTLQAIADALNEEGVATLRGGAKWRPSSVQRAAGYRRPASPRVGIELPRPSSNGRNSG